MWKRIGKTEWSEVKKIKFHHKVKRFYYKNLFRKIYTVAIIGLIGANIFSIIKYTSFAEELLGLQIAESLDNMPRTIALGSDGVENIISGDDEGGVIRSGGDGIQTIISIDNELESSELGYNELEDISSGHNLDILTTAGNDILNPVSEGTDVYSVEDLSEKGIFYKTPQELCNLGNCVNYVDTQGNSFPMGTIQLVNGSKSFTILDRNLGATSTGNGAGTDKASYGYLFQWGNNYGFYSTSGIYFPTSSTPVNGSLYSWRYPYINSTYINYNENWANSYQDDAWGDVTNQDYARQGPCPAGWHIPSISELNDFIGTYTYAMYGVSFSNERIYNSAIANGFIRDFHVGRAGVIEHGGPSRYGYNTRGYWTMTTPVANSTRVRRMVVGNGDLTTDSTYALRASMASVRCFKNSSNVSTVMLTFDSRGGQLMNTQTVPLNGVAHTPGYSPKKDGYEFKGWYMDTDMTIPLVFGETVFTEDTTVYAKWKGPEPDFIISFEVGGGTPMIGNQIVENNGTGTQPQDPTKPGYIFQYWYLSGVDEPFDFEKTSITGNIMLYAKWDCAPNYHSENGECIYNIKTDNCTPGIMDNGEYTVEPVEIARNEEIEDWNTVACTKFVCDTHYHTGDSSCEKDTFIITFDTNLSGVNSPNSQVVIRGEMIGVLPEVSSDGYVFSGWYDGDELVTGGTIFSKDTDITLVARRTCAENYHPDKGLCVIQKNTTCLTGNEMGVLYDIKDVIVDWNTGANDWYDAPACEIVGCKEGYHMKSSSVSYYVIDDSDSNYLQGCNTPGLENPEKCILRTSDNYCIAPKDTETIKDRYDANNYCNSMDVLGLDWALPNAYSSNGGLYWARMVGLISKIYGLDASNSEKPGHYRAHPRTPTNENCTLAGACGNELGNYLLSVRCVARCTNIIDPKSTDGDDWLCESDIKQEICVISGTVENGQYITGLVNVTWNVGLKKWNLTPQCTNFICDTHYHTGANNDSCEIDTFTITWKDGYETLKTEILPYGANPSYSTGKEYYTFLRWDPSIIPVAGDMTYTAVWQANTDANGDNIADEEQPHHTLTIHYVNSKGNTVYSDYVENIVQGANYTITSPEKAHYIVDPSIVSGKMGTKDVEVTVTYRTETNDTNDNGVADEDETPHTLTINYEYSRGGKVAGSVQGTYLEGITYSITSPIITNYEANQLVVEGTMPIEDKTITVKYSPKNDDNDNGIADEEEERYSVVVHYEYSRGGAVTGDQSVVNLLPNQRYNIVSPEIQYYAPDQSIVSGSIDGESLSGNIVEITVKYKPNNDVNNNGIADEEEKSNSSNYSGRGRKGESATNMHNSADDEKDPVQPIASNDDKQSVEIKGSTKNPESEMNTENYDSRYTPEQHSAYQFAKSHGITTTASIREAKMNTPLTRIEMAKMLSYYAMNVMNKQPDMSIGTIKFVDVPSKLDYKYDNGVTLAYQLGIMGINMPENKFRPNDRVTRAEFATALSRMIYGMEDGKGRVRYYEPHIARLYNEGIINNTNPKLQEQRGYVMIMLMRSIIK